MIYGCEICHHSWEGPAITDIEGKPLDMAGYKCTECGHWNYIKDSLKRFTGEGLKQLVFPTENGD